MNRIWSTTMIAVLTASLGYFFGQARTAAVPQLETKSQPRTSPLEVIAHAAAARPSEVEDGFWREMRAMVREEIRAAQPAGSPDGHEVAKPVEPTAENVTAYESASSLVSGAVTAHRWTKGDAARLRALTGEMSQPQYLEVMHTLLPAINSGQLALEGAPF